MHFSFRVELKNYFPKTYKFSVYCYVDYNFFVYLYTSSIKNKLHS